MRIYTLLFLQRPHINSGALYTCALCDILLESLAHAFRHIRDKRHKKKAKVRTRTQMAEVAGPSPPRRSLRPSSLENAPFVGVCRRSWSR